MSSNTVSEALKAAASFLQQSDQLDDDIDAALEASILLGHALNRNHAWLYAWPEFSLDENQLNTFNQAIYRRSQGEPISHITGKKEFWSLEFKVTSATLIPRPETELLVETALKLGLNERARILELGTGTGAIATSLAHERPGWKIYATDINPQTLAIARQNFLQHEVNIDSVVSNWFENIQQTGFDLILSNPPYIAEADPHLKQGDLRFEPGTALASGKDGLNDCRTIIRNSPAFLADQGFLLLEHGYNQGPELRNLFKKHGFTNIQTLPDLSGIERITLGQKI